MAVSFCIVKILNEVDPKLRAISLEENDWKDEQTLMIIDDRLSEKFEELLI